MFSREGAGGWVINVWLFDFGEYGGRQVLPVNNWRSITWFEPETLASIIMEDWTKNLFRNLQTF